MAFFAKPLDKSLMPVLQILQCFISNDKSKTLVTVRLWFPPDTTVGGRASEDGETQIAKHAEKSMATSLPQLEHVSREISGNSIATHLWLGNSRKVRVLLILFGKFPT